MRYPTIPSLCIVRPHSPHRNLSTTHADAVYCCRRSIPWSVDLSVWRDREPCKNGWADRDVVWNVDSDGSKEASIRWGCTLAQPGEYDWTVNVRRRCGLFVKFDHLHFIVIRAVLFVFSLYDITVTKNWNRCIRKHHEEVLPAITILLYGLECFQLGKADLQSLDFTFNRLCMKLFKTGSIDV